MILNQMSSILEGNFLFKNNGDLTFTNKTDDWGISRKFKSNGAAYADLDNDGDQDLIINAMNEPAVVYKNNATENKLASFLTIDLFKLNPKMVVTGTKVYIHTGDTTQYMEFSPCRGYQSCMYVPLNVGVNKNERIDSVRIIWPDNKTQLFKNISSKEILKPLYGDARDRYNYPPKTEPLFATADTIAWRHKPADNNDFKRQFLLPKMYSVNGPKMTDGDVNNDGLTDFYVCGPQHESGALFLQQPGGNFKIKKTSAFEADKEHQDEDALFFDVDSDKDLDLYVVSGGYAFEKNDPLLQDRLYLNDGKGNFVKTVNALPKETLAGTCVVAIDIDNDQDIDLFVGSRLIPGQYPLSPESMLLINDGKAHFENKISELAPGLQQAGMVCDAQAADLNKDGKTDLIIVGEWMPIKIMINSENKLSDETARWISKSSDGLWNCVTAEDFDLDGDLDLVAGNYGLNNQFNVSADHPATLVYKDFNNDGEIDPFFCYYIKGSSFPYASRDEALGQVSFLKQRFPDYTSYANATLETMFTPDELKGSKTLRAGLLKTVYFENKGNKFEIKDLPIQAQFSPVYTLAAFDIDHDGDKDLVMGGNETWVRARLGKSDANHGFVFLNNGKGEFKYMPQYQSGLNLNGDVRQLLFISSASHTRLLASETGSSIKSYVLKK
jgi:hypothetical protein